MRFISQCGLTLLVLHQIVYSQERVLPVDAASVVKAESVKIRPLRLIELSRLLDVPAILQLETKQTPMADDDEGSSVKSGSAQLETVSLHKAIELGLTYSPEVMAAQFRATSFEEVRKAARGPLLPRLDFRAGQGRGRLESITPSVGTLRMERSLIMTQALYDEPSRRELNRQGILANSAVVGYQGAQSAAAIEIASAYLQAVQSRLTIELDEAATRRNTILLHSNKK